MMVEWRVCRNPTLQLTHAETTRERLIAYSRKVPGAYIGIKIAALLLILEANDRVGLSRY